MAYKTFLNGYPLPASELNTYLMGQVVATFADASERSAAITSPVEGQLTYLEDANAYYTYTGSAWTMLNTGDVAGKNKIINGAFDFWQRGTSYTMNGAPAYGAADRWIYWHNGSTLGTNTISKQAFTPGTAPVAGYEVEAFHRWTATTLGTGQTVCDMWHKIEDVRTFAGQTVTLSFWAKASAAFVLSLYTDQNFGSGGSPAVNNGMGDVTLSTSWQRFTKTITLPSISGKTVGTSSFIQVMLRLINPTAGATFDVWGVQLEVGSVATPFSRAAGTLQGELAACQRYYWRSTPGTTYGVYGMGNAYATTAGQCSIKLPVSMRVNPTSVETPTASNLRVNDGTATIALNATPTVDANQTSTDIATITISVASGLTAGRTYTLQNNNNSSAYVGFSAEL